ncbi:hypothetical protein MLD38_018333 [Melastoma candidum]|uniref:Uncharacterized protein n=1 Tax=Melastoma candidum TaxID=119954 RepID=A0ACB9QSY0_9MYRT|nr:hypothetical protein MLD38_018333 [Melastoma candidum]
MDAPRPAAHNPAMSLVARLDHLDFVLNRLEAKQDPKKMGSRTSAEREFLPLNVAVRDAYFKGSLLDRVATLENRLFRLYLEMDTSGPSSESMPTATAQREAPTISSTTVFAIPNPPLGRHGQPTRAELPEIQEEASAAPGSGKEQKKKRSSATVTKKGGVVGKDNSGGGIVRRKGKARNYSTFMNILGCSI